MYRRFAARAGLTEDAPYARVIAAAAMPENGRTDVHRWQLHCG
jgi:hypothetical protein